MSIDEQDECRCGQIHEPALQPLIDWFDDAYGDKAYRRHDELVDKVNHIVGAAAALLDDLEREHKQRNLLPAALAYSGAAAVVRNHVGIV